MDLRERFLLAVDHIEDHLMEPLRLAEVAACAKLSPPYFSRLFRVLTGEPFGSYVRRRRLTIAAARLASKSPAPRLAELAFDCQYDSQEAFTRAFKRTFGRTPGAFRARPPASRALWRERLDLRILDHLKEGLTMEPEIVEIDVFVVAGLRQRFDEESKHGIPALWDRFHQRRDEIRFRRRAETYGVCANADPEDGSFDYIAAAPVERVDTLPEGMIAETVPRQTYAVFTHKVRGTPLHEELQPTIRWIWGTWLPASSYEYVPGPDFEVYPADFDPLLGSGNLEICVPVRAKS